MVRTGLACSGLGDAAAVVPLRCFSGTDGLSGIHTATVYLCCCCIRWLLRLSAVGYAGYVMAEESKSREANAAAAADQAKANTRSVAAETR